MRSLIIYYSYGQNTKRIAEMVQKKIGGDIARTAEKEIEKWVDTIK